MPVKPEQIIKDFQRAYRHWSPLHKEMEGDFEFAQGKQWDDSDVAKLEAAGVKALTVNKIRPIIKLVTGIERQSKSDFVAFPEGGEDGLVADIVTALLKNLAKNSRAENKLSEQFKRGCIGGCDYIEPYLDYTYDLVNPCLKLRNVPAIQVFPDPDAEEYDLSDGKFLVKFSKNLSKDQLLELYPDEESKIEKITNGKIDLANMDALIKRHIETPDYPALSEATKTTEEQKEYGFDLIEYQYKSMINKYYVVDKIMGKVQEMTKEEASSYGQSHPDVKVITKKVPEIRIASYVGGVIIVDSVLWTYPRWRSFGIIPFFAEWLNIGLGDLVLRIQGVVRSLKDLQYEFNKRRTQQLRHLNSSVNSGMIYADDALTPDQEENLKNYGSSPGITIKYKAGTLGKPEKILPTPLSQGHAQLAEENANDLKEASGVNPDLLANSDNDQSGRAILLKQKQGLVMVQEMLDNYARTKKLIGSFLLSQLGEIYTIEKVIRVLGQDFFKKYQEFNKPIVDDMGQPVINPANGQLETEIDQEAVNGIINQVLNDPELGNYDVTIGEGAYSETVKISNYMTLADMVSKGIPIPPDVLVEESMLPQGTKQRIVASIEKANMMAQQAKAQGAVNVG